MRRQSQRRRLTGCGRRVTPGSVVRAQSSNRRFAAAPHCELAGPADDLFELVIEDHPMEGVLALGGRPFARSPGVGEVLELVPTEVPAALVLGARDPVTLGQLTDPGARQAEDPSGLAAAAPVGVSLTEPGQRELLDLIWIQHRMPVVLGATEVTGEHEPLYGAGC